MTPHEITLFIYNISLFPIIFFSILFLMLSMLNILAERKKVKKTKKLEELPFVTVQIPTYNDPIAERCVRHCMDFNYPEDKYEIVIADDSTNEDTKRTLKEFADNNPGFIKYAHRTNRVGFKAGALKEVMNVCKGEIIVIFDSDWMPKKDFLNEIVQPFADEAVALVQTRQGMYNKNKNLITRFASYVLMIYHTIVMPINNKINCVFFCGTAGALRRKHFEEVGGWNLNSITEDSELTVKLLSQGYKSIYLDIETPSETPDTIEGFVKQQMRWCYGNTRVFIDNAFNILFKAKLTIKQRLMITYITLGNLIAPVVVLMTLFGFAGWFIGEPQIMTLSDVMDMTARIILTAGFLVIGTLTLYKKNILNEFPKFILSVLSIGIILAVANTVAFSRAIINKRLHWHCTPKVENDKFA
ncbi:glycosyltransferase [Candidatus Woesearchaeota archaeon]|nr:glycosyltransferase [Candidatus Woesearchaeota archaeon]